MLIVARGASSCRLPDGQRQLHEGGKTPIVEVNREDSPVSLICGEQLTILGVSDLVKAIVEPFSRGAGQP